MKRIINPSRRRNSKSRLAIAAACLVVAGAGALAESTPASAYTSTSTGSPGTTTTPFTYGTWGPMSTGKITVPYRTVYESAAYRNYDQTVCVTPRLWSIKMASFGSPASWVFQNKVTNCATIPAASTAAVVNGVDFTNPLFYTGYSVDVVVTWSLSNGAVIGTRTYDYSHANDYRCTNAGCSIGTTNWGGGAFMQMDW